MRFTCLQPLQQHFPQCVNWHAKSPSNYPIILFFESFCHHGKGDLNECFEVKSKGLLISDTNLAFSWRLMLYFVGKSCFCVFPPTNSVILWKWLTYSFFLDSTIASRTSRTINAFKEWKIFITWKKIVWQKLS